MRLERYSDQIYLKEVKDYCLKDATHTDSPISIIKKSKIDPNRYSVVILNNQKIWVGFFCLHLDEGPASFGYFGKQFALIRGFSIDERYRRRGYASQSFKDIFDFTDSSVRPDIKEIILTVNENNKFAQKAYHDSGFSIIKTGIEGKLGKLMIMSKKR